MDRPSPRKTLTREPEPNRPSWWIVPPEAFADAHRQWLTTQPQQMTSYARPHGKDD